MNPVLLSPEHLSECFSSTYKQAASRFSQIARRTGDGNYRELAYDHVGPEGERLTTGVCWQGNPDASRVLVIQSATHGVEGFAGSAIQVDAMNQLSEESLGEDVAILYIHAINAYGFAWLRRVNEQGVDLNRNFVDFMSPLPGDPEYAKLADLLLPVDAGSWEKATRALWRYRDEFGQEAFDKAVTQGQYQFPDGLFYGGLTPSASRCCLESLIQDYHIQKRDLVAIIDVHTGLGPFGYGELICDHPPGSQGVALAKQWYGDSVTEPALHTSSSVPKLGLIDYLWQEQLGDRACFVTLEFGTYSLQEMIEVLRRDHALHRTTVDWNDKSVQQVKQSIRRFFYPATPDWQEMVLMRGRQVIRQAIQGLCEKGRQL